MKCERCSGLVIAMSFVGGDEALGAWEYDGMKCLNCGHITDPLFMKNRRIRARQGATRQLRHRRMGCPDLQTEHAA